MLFPDNKKPRKFGAFCDWTLYAITGGSAQSKRIFFKKLLLMRQ